MKTSHFRSFALALIIAGMLSAAAGSSRAQQHPTPSTYAWPIQHRALQQAIPLRPAPRVQVNVVVLEPLKGKSGPITDAFRTHFPDSDVSQPVFRCVPKDAKAIDQFVQHLAEADMVRVVSRPAIMTVSGRKATVQVGQRVKVPRASAPGKDDSRDIGLTLHCLPKVTDGDHVRMEMEIRHATAAGERKGADADYPIINEQAMSTTVSTKSGETLVLRKAEGFDSLVILISPKVVPAIAQMAQNPARPAQPRVVAFSAFAEAAGAVAPLSVMSNLQRIKKAMNSVAPGAAQDISLRGTEFQIQAILDSSERINEVVNALAKIDSIEIKTVRIYAKGDKTQFEADGQIKQPASVPFRRVTSDRYVQSVTTRKESPELARLRALVSELYPDEKDLQIRQLNQSVLLRGKVSERAMKILVTIAEDFFPNVINDLAVTETPKQGVKQKPQIRQTLSPQPKNVADEVRQLRDDVKSLRADVKKIIELLQRPPANKAAHIGPPAVDSPTRYEWKKAKSADWNLTLSQALALARENRPANASADKSSENERAESVCQKFAELKQTRRQWLAAKQTTTFPIAVASSVSAMPPGFETTLPLGARRTLAQQRALELRLARAETELRELLGVAPDDGRVLIPVELEGIE